MKEVVYKEVPGWPNYMVGSDGSVLSNKSGEWKPRATNIGSTGYPEVHTMMNGKRKKWYVHRMVALAFLGECPIGFEVNHKDSNRKNSSIENLEYVSRTQNIRHAMKSTGAYTRGPNNPRPIGMEVANSIRVLSESHTVSELANKFSTSKETVRRAISGKTYASGKL